MDKGFIIKFSFIGYILIVVRTESKHFSLSKTVNDSSKGMLLEHLIAPEIMCKRYILLTLSSDFYNLFI